MWRHKENKEFHKDFCLWKWISLMNTLLNTRLGLFGNLKMRNLLNEKISFNTNLIWSLTITACSAYPRVDTFLLNLSQNFIQKNFEKNNQLISDENGFDKRLKVLGTYSTNYVFSVHAFLEKPLSLNFQIYDPVCDLAVKFPCSFWLVDPKSFSKQTRKIFISLPLYA